MDTKKPDAERKYRTWSEIKREHFSTEEIETAYREIITELKERAEKAESALASIQPSDSYERQFIVVKGLDHEYQEWLAGGPLPKQPESVPDAENDIKRAREILADWCSNHGDKFTMRIPCQDYDDDVVMSRVIDAAEKALAQSQPESDLQEKLHNAYKNIEELSGTLAQLQAKPPEQGQPIGLKKLSDAINKWDATHIDLDTGGILHLDLDTVFEAARSYLMERKS